jgi:hypothetical protein
MSEVSNRDLAARFGRAAMGSRQQREPEQAVAEDLGEANPETSRDRRKFTLIFRREEAEALDEFLLHARRRLGRRVDKSEVVRSLLELTYTDPSLEEQLLEHLRHD